MVEYFNKTKKRQNQCYGLSPGCYGLTGSKNKGSVSENKWSKNGCNFSGFVLMDLKPIRIDFCTKSTSRNGCCDHFCEKCDFLKPYFTDFRSLLGGRPKNGKGGGVQE